MQKTNQLITFFTTIQKAITATKLHGDILVYVQQYSTGNNQKKLENWDWKTEIGNCSWIEAVAQNQSEEKWPVVKRGEIIKIYGTKLPV